jgi:hypothetical protein
MTYAWDRQAERVQQSVRQGELDRPSDYSESEARQAVVHTRLDLVMVVSLLSSVNEHLPVIKLTLFVAVLTLFYIAYRFTVR